MNAQKQENKERSSELINREPIMGTPFTLINYDNQGWFLTMGKYQLSKAEEYTKDELLKMVKEKDWKLIITTIGLIVTYELNNQNQ